MTRAIHQKIGHVTWVFARGCVRFVFILFFLPFIRVRIRCCVDLGIGHERLVRDVPIESIERRRRIARNIDLICLVKRGIC